MSTPSFFWGLRNLRDFFFFALPYLFGHLVQGPFCGPDRKLWRQASSVEWPPDKTDSNACPSPAHDSLHQTRKSGPQHSGKCCLFDWQSNFP